MNKEYIERDWLIDWFTFKGKDAEIINEVGQVPLPTIRENIKDAPAADVVEVRHEKWEKRGHKYQCTGCKVLMSIDGTPEENLLYYCPVCGAKMDKEEYNEL